MPACYASNATPLRPRHARFWARLLLLYFSVGVVSGIPLEFAFDANWSPFSAASGDFFGNILGFEGAMAFMLEAGFLGIALFGWNRVPRGMHLFATSMVALGASLSAFWIMVANAWMQTPAGVVAQDGVFQVTDYAAAIFNPAMPTSVMHMWVACPETSLLVIVTFIVMPLQLLIGDAAGRVMVEHQPAKLAAIEAHWHTNFPEKARPGRYWPGRFPSGRPIAGHYCERRTGAMV